MNEFEINGSNYYELLECESNASHDEIKRAFYKLALKHHPDKNDESKENTREFQSILDAWKVLGIKETREEYDRICKQAKLNAESALVYATIGLDDLQTVNNSTLLRYPCRCGDYYCIEKEDLMEKNCTFHVSCSQCSFIIVINT